MTALRPYLATCMAASLFTATGAAAETRSYVISLFHQAVYSQDNDCDGGPEPTIDSRFRSILAELGKTPEEIDELMAGFGGGDGRAKVAEIMRNRGSPEGRRVNVADNPTQVADPKIKTVIGKLAPGFNLDGRLNPDSFEDPVTHETGIDNQYFRAMGCFVSHRATPPDLPANWSYFWDATRDRTKGWVLTIEGADLSKDGEITVKFARAIETPVRTPQGLPQRDQTFRIDTRPRYFNSFKGRMKDGVVTIDPNQNLHIVTGGGYLPLVMRMTRTQMRLTPKADGSIEGLLGGYQPWMELYYMYAGGSYGYEAIVGLNLPGIYYAMRRLADGEPDPKTGQNMAISTAYRFEAVPAIVLDTTSTAKATQ